MPQVDSNPISRIQTNLSLTRKKMQICEPIYKDSKNSSGILLLSKMVLAKPPYFLASPLPVPPIFSPPLHHQWSRLVGQRFSFPPPTLWV